MGVTLHLATYQSIHRLFNNEEFFFKSFLSNTLCLLSNFMSCFPTIISCSLLLVFVKKLRRKVRAIFWNSSNEELSVVVFNVNTTVFPVNVVLLYFTSCDSILHCLGCIVFSLSPQTVENLSQIKTQLAN